MGSVMKILFAIVAIASLSSAFFIQGPACETIDPLVASGFCNFGIPACRIPRCAKDPTDNTFKWFVSNCQIKMYNRSCRTRYVRVADTNCDAAFKPIRPEGVCPFPWIRGADI